MPSGLSRRTKKLEEAAGNHLGPPISSITYVIYDVRVEPQPGFANILVGPNAGLEMLPEEGESLDDFNRRVQLSVRGGP